MEMQQSLKDVTLSSDQARRRAMAENLVRSWPRDRAWSFGFAWRWAVDNHYDPKSFQDLLRRIGIEQGFGTISNVRKHTISSRPFLHAVMTFSDKGRMQSGEAMIFRAARSMKPSTIGSLCTQEFLDHYTSADVWQLTDLIRASES
ncbi:hypothetical protein [Phyllobacterium sp. P5_D12]